MAKDGGKHPPIQTEKPKMRFTQSAEVHPNTDITVGGVQTAVEAFRDDILSKFEIRNKKGYGDISPPMQRDIDTKRTLGAKSGPGHLPRFAMSKQAKGRAKY